MNQRYVDFSLGIEGADRGGYRVRAFSPDAEAEADTRFDFDLDALSRRLRSRASSDRPQSQELDAVQAAGAPAPGMDLAEVGRGLFDALLPGEVRELYSAAWSGARAAGRGLRVRLHLRPRTPELAWLTKIPWEVVYDERAGCFPCLNPLSPLVRHLDLPRAADRAPLQLPLRVLVAAASPAGMAELDLRRELESLQALPQIRAKVLQGAGPEDLRLELLRGGYQVVHFMGHGLSDASQGSLIFATPDGRARPVTGSALSQLFQGAPALAFTLLNACHSAAVPKGSSAHSAADALAGVAGALVRGGQAAVVGMQLTIRDRAALAFSKVLYAQLADGKSIESAVAEARLALYLRDTSASDWVAPVLFVRGADRRVEEAAGNDRQPGQGERDRIRVALKADQVAGRHMVVRGELRSGPQPDPSRTRPRDIETLVEARTMQVDNLIITGSEQQDRGED
jgi:CHAT domain